MSRAKPLMFRFVTCLHESAYKLSGGRVGGRTAGMAVLLLTTTGRKTGKPRTTPLMYLPLDGGDAVAVVASYGGDDHHPAWYLNLSAKPEVEVRRGTRTERMVARTATPEEKAELWPRIVASFKGYAEYQRKTDREIPVVILTPVEPGDAGGREAGSEAAAEGPPSV